jgi:hypothetical protein
MNEVREVGRRTLCTPELATLAGDLLKLGLSDSETIELLPISQSTFYAWQRRGGMEEARLQEPGSRRRKREAVFLLFMQTIKAANAARVEALLTRIWDAAAGRGTSMETKSTYDGAGELESRVVIERQAKPTWTASAWLLERLDWSRFSQHKMLDQTGDWRAEARAAGIEDPEAMFEDLVQRYTTAMLDCDTG